MPGPISGVHVAAVARVAGGTSEARTRTIAATMRTVRATPDRDARYGRTLRFGLFFVGPLELVERGARDAAGLEPFVSVGLAAGAVSPSAFFGDIKGARGIDRRLAPMSLAHADELDEGAVHSYESDSPGKQIAVSDVRSGRRDSDPRPFGWEPNALPG